MPNMVVDPKWNPPDPFYAPYPFPPAPITAAELARRLGSEGEHGSFLLREYMKWIEDKQPVDRMGYPYIHDPEQLKRWRHHQVKRMIHALDTVRDMWKMMENKDNSYQ